MLIRRRATLMRMTRACLLNWKAAILLANVLTSFDSETASAVLDRLVHHAHLVPIIGDSYRMKDLKQRQKGDPQPKK